ncbi:MAG: methyltransferase domain-containing protein [Syntrophobacteraceae bacterium]
MKREILNYLICPRCLPEESPLRLGNFSSSNGEITEGRLECSRCTKVYPITDGIACLGEDPGEGTGGKGFYESEELLSTYLWTHYADLFGDSDATAAYSQWSAQIAPISGAGLDTGCATGRFSFEMSAKCDLVIGVDCSMRFVAMARRLLRERKLAFKVKEEGRIYREKSFLLPPRWNSQKVEFVVADAQALPFRSGAFACLASLNIVDKTPHPLKHLEEVCRTARAGDSQLLISDPFSWSEDFCSSKDWLGGTSEGRFAGSGIDNIERFLCKQTNGWSIERRGALWWKIRNHRNHFELIRSLFIKAHR